MRPALRWGLGATVVASAASLWVGDQSARVVAAVERVQPGHVQPAAGAAAPEATNQPPLPATLEPIALEASRRDIFEPVQPPPPPPPPAPKPFVGPLLPPPPPPPPAMNWRYFGSMTTPAGERIVMLARGEQSSVVKPGSSLDDGYVVESIRADAVRVQHPPTGTVVDIPIGPPPSSSR